MCKNVRDLIDLYVAGDLEPEEAREVEEHLAACEACSREAASYRTCLDNLGTLASEKQPNRLSPFFWQGIQKEILTARERVGPRSSRRRRVIYALAAAILIAVTAYVAAALFGGSQGAPDVPDLVDTEETWILPPGTPVLPERDRLYVGSEPDAVQNEENDSLEF